MEAAEVSFFLKNFIILRDLRQLNAPAPVRPGIGSGASERERVQ